MMLEAGVFIILLFFAYFRDIKLYQKLAKVNLSLPDSYCDDVLFDTPVVKLCASTVFMLNEWIAPNFDQRFQMPLFMKCIVLCILILFLIPGVMCRIYFYKDGLKVMFYLFAWLMLSGLAAQTYAMSPLAVIRMFSNCFYVAVTQATMIEFDGILSFLKKDDGLKEFCSSVSSRLSTIKYLHIIHGTTILFQLVLASMIALNAPFYLFWVHFAVDDILYILCWFYIFAPISNYDLVFK